MVRLLIIQTKVTLNSFIICLPFIWCLFAYKPEKAFLCKASTFILTLQIKKLRHRWDLTFQHDRIVWGGLGMYYRSPLSPSALSKPDLRKRPVKWPPLNTRNML